MHISIINLEWQSIISMRDFWRKKMKAEIMDAEASISPQNNLFSYFILAAARDMNSDTCNSLKCQFYTKEMLTI